MSWDDEPEVMAAKSGGARNSAETDNAVNAEKEKLVAQWSVAEAIANTQKFAFEEGFTLARESFRKGFASAFAESDSLMSALTAANVKLDKIERLLREVKANPAAQQSPLAWAAALDKIAGILDV